MDSYDIIWYVHIVYISNIYVYHMLFFCIFVEIFFTVYINSHLSLKKIDYSKMFETEKYVKIVSYL